MKKIISILVVFALSISFFLSAAAVTVQSAEFVLGDVNGDGIVSINDVTAIQRHLAQLEQLPDERLKAAMVSDGKTLTITDATTIQKKLAEMIDEFPVEQTKTLVVYFSRTGNTKPLAVYAAEFLGADIFEIEAAIPYTDADIAYYTNCRADREQSDPTARPEIAYAVENMAQYDTIILAYPIWHGQAPRVIYTFLESYDFSGKTIIPFCTSASSGIGSSATNLHAIAPEAEWKDGRRFPAGTSVATIAEWLDSFGLTATDKSTEMTMFINDTPVNVEWEDNEAVHSLKELCRNQPLTIQMSVYGGFEQVGSIGAALPRNDVQTTTSAGDIVLYSGNRIVVFYGSNTWAYTKLGHITDKTPEELTQLLSNENVTITLGS